MTDNVRITVLVENTAESPRLLTEHGLAFWIEIGSQCVLFDTGQGGVLVNNAYRLPAPRPRRRSIASRTDSTLRESDELRSVDSRPAAG